MRTLHTKKLRLVGSDGHPKYLLGISEDVTERQANENRLTYLASHDDLTGLLNRPVLLARLASAWDDVQDAEHSIAILYIDLDGFKEVNDMYGHPVGDHLLKVIAYLLGDAVNSQHTVARVGGDEFVVLMNRLHRQAEAMDMAEEIRSRCEMPFHLSGREIVISTSIGISMFPGPVESAEDLLRTADIAMYRAKARGKNAYAIYSPDMQTETMERVELGSLLRLAVPRGELTVHFQPRLSVADGRIIGAEALVRWNSPQLGFVSPARFIPIAEESGLIRQIGEWVLRTACTQAAEWQKIYGQRLRIAVNLSAYQLRQQNLLGVIKSALRNADLEPSLLELEITESAFMDKDLNPIAVLNAISDMGIQLAVDDFGTGYSNLAYLKQLPVDVLKIDQSFVRGLTTDPNDRAIVSAIISMAKSLQLSVTAEGVENNDQLEALRQLQCDEFQGYLASRPVPAAEFERLLAS